jgi:hypothetical protein
LLDTIWIPMGITISIWEWIRKDLVNFFNLPT